MDIIKVDNLTKSFGDIKAVQNITFRVKEGELFAFLGTNGAGKSTTINILCGQLGKDSGTVVIDEHELSSNLHYIKSQLGVVFQNSLLDSALSVYENLESRASLYGITGDVFKNRLKALSELLDFKDLLKRRVGKLSGGQRRRIDMARALIHKPKILILDEPTTGLDPYTRNMLWNIIFNLRKKENVTIFLTTHYMEESADADYVVILDNGKISAEGTPIDLKSSYAQDFITIYGVSEELVRKLNLKYEKVNNGYRLPISNTSEARELIVKYPECFKDFEITKGKMDDVFLAVTGKSLVESEKNENN